MPLTVGDVFNLLDKHIPFETAEEWDNSGLLVGSKHIIVNNIICALDLSLDVIDEAISRDCQLIITHHPILFRGCKNLVEDYPEGKLICHLVRSGLALISVHTNYDVAVDGVNFALADAIALNDILPYDSGMHIGTLSPMPLDKFTKRVEKALGGCCRSYGDKAQLIERVAVMGGAGEDYGMEALSAGADLFITGEISYHKALSLVDAGICVIEAGHAATELPGIRRLVQGLQIEINSVQCNIGIFESSSKLFL